MNIDNINRLADYFDNLPEGEYYQGAVTTINNCPSCLAAHASDLHGNFCEILDIRFDKYEENQEIFSDATIFLGIDNTVADQLFDGNPIPGENINTKDVVHVLRNLAKTGKVIWEKVE